MRSIARRLPAALLVGALAAGVVGLAAPAPGAPAVKRKRAVTWQGAFFAVGTGGDPLTCQTSCEQFLVRARRAKRDQRGSRAPIHFTIRWNGSDDDFDLFVVRPDGRTLTGTPQGGTSELATDARPIRGMYRIAVVAVSVTDSSYAGRVRVGRVPKPKRSKP